MTSKPQTQSAIAKDLRDLGLTPGMTVMVHSAFGQVGWTVGGPVSVIRAIFDVLGPRGTLVMPAASPNMGDPETWDDARVHPEWYDTIRAHLPVFDATTTPTTMGALAEAFRTFPGTLRSDHPLVSVAANGPKAAEVVADHALAFSEGAGTPFEKLYELEAYTLLLGVGFDRCTSLHYAESLCEDRRTTTNKFPVMEGDRRVWKEVADMGVDGGTLFPKVGAQFLATGAVSNGTIGNARSMLFSTKALVDFAKPYFDEVLGQRNARA